MVRLLYTILLTLALPLLVLRLFRRAVRSPGYARHIGERFGSGGQIVRPGADTPVVWVHAVSVGETMAAAPLVNSLLLREPRPVVVLTTMTPTGRQRAEELFADRVHIAYAPYDVPCLIRRFLRRVTPDLMIVLETELWPNTIDLAHRAGIKTMLANGRLSPKSAAGYARFPRTTSAILNGLDLIAVQSEEDAARFLSLGAVSDQVHTLGSLKFSSPQPSVDEQTGADSTPGLFAGIKASGRPVLVAASTRDQEEAKLLTAFRSVIERRQDALLIIVPRHPERFDSVALLCERNGFHVQRRSQSSVLAANTQIVIGDSMGEMTDYYACATVAFVGGSLVDTGCQNVLEPAAAGVPVLVGPSQYNFAAICRVLEEAGALLTVPDEEQLAQAVVRLFGDPDLLSRMGQMGTEVVQANQQALPRHLSLIEQLLNK